MAKINPDTIAALTAPTEDAHRADKRTMKLADPRVRWGKTKSDRDNGAHKRADDNRAARADWVRTNASRTNVDPKTFPLHTCNGKKSRSLRRPNNATGFETGGASRSRATIRRHNG